MKNVVLIGMPGAGKSTVGVVLAKNIGFRFVDSDLCIQEQEQQLLHEIISEKGLETFLKIENEVNASLNFHNSVIATGGSVIYGEKAMKHLKEKGTIIYLQLSYDNICERLGDLSRRGVAMKEEQTLLELYRERVPLYEAYADRIIVCDGKPIRQIVQEIVSTPYLLQ